MNVINYSNLENIIPNVHTVIDRTGFKGWSVPTRTINDHELVLILEGKGSFTIEEKEYSVQPGMLFYFYPDLIHSGETRLDEPMHFLAVHFSFAFASYSGNEYTIDTSPYKLPLKPVNQLHHYYQIQQVFEHLYKTWLEKGSSYQWQSKILFQEFLFKVLYDLKNPPQNYTNVNRIKHVLNYINKHYTEHINISQLCSMVQLSRGHFTKIFKHTTGKTPVEHINQVRIEHAKDLLTSTTLPIKDLSRQIGFNDEFYFTRVFKQYEGCSPLEYRNCFSNL
ncbi:AraC family transcriptional regulator [Vallitalea okinawensis]|uniref:AraC family transcriptional regulator n=1 Tax=Vallitalea okinawensis TaxID=2078660 RepID=UPI0014785743|nr:AraC family transcriptional regulator [Vallitalea okinawensis]